MSMVLDTRFHIWLIMTVCYEIYRFFTKCNNCFITKCDTSLLQNVSGFSIQCGSFITKRDSYYKMRRLLQNCNSHTLTLINSTLITYTLIHTLHLHWLLIHLILLTFIIKQQYIDYFIIYWFWQFTTVHVFHFYKQLLLYYAIKTIELMMRRWSLLKKNINWNIMLI